MAGRRDASRRSDGRYVEEARCDLCGRTIGPNEEYGTDSEVCGNTDGPGFLLCMRSDCGKEYGGDAFFALQPEERAVVYEAVRARSERRLRRGGR